MQHLAPELPAAVRQALDRILASAEFSRAPRHSRFLSFVVEEALQGRASQLKEYTIGVEVFGKPPTFEPRADSTVRTEASKLRTRLDHYYSKGGGAQPIRIVLPRGGYTPEFIESEAVAPPVPVVARVAARIRRWRLALILVAMACLAAAIFFAFFLFGNRKPPLPVVARLYALTSLPGSKRLPAWSPDGKNVVFCWERVPGNFDLYVISGEGGLPRQLTSDAAQDWAPAWSPNGQVIAFVRNPFGSSQVILIPAGGGSERVLEGVFGRRLAWTPDGRSLVTQTNVSPEGPQALYLVDVATLARKQLTFPNASDDSSGHTALALSPGGDQIAFVTRRDGGLLIQTTPVGRWSPEPLLTIGRDFGGLAWSRDGKGLFVTTKRLQYVPLAMPQLLKISGLSVFAGHPDVARRAPAKIVFVNSPQFGDLWQVRSGKEMPLVTSVADESSPRFSRDGSRLVFASDRSGSPQLWSASRDGGNVRQHTSILSCEPLTADWSPDGRTLAFDCEQAGHSWLYLVNADGGEPSRIDAAGSNARRPAFSSDGRWIYFISPGPKHLQVSKLSADGHGLPLLIHPGPAFEAKEAGNGEFLYFTRQPKDSGLWRYALREGGETLVSDRAVSGWWDVTAKGVYWAQVEKAGALSFWLLDQIDGRRKRLASAQGTQLPGMTGFTVSPDGTIVFLKSMRATEDLMVAEFDRD